MPKRVTVQAFAEMEQKHEKTIYRWIEEGKLNGKNGSPKAIKDSGGFGWFILLPDTYQAGLSLN